MADANEIGITTISIPKTLAEKIRKRMEGTGFRSVSSYVTYVLRQLISGIEMDAQGKEREAFTKEDENKVKERLRALGYID